VQATIRRDEVEAGAGEEEVGGGGGARGEEEGSGEEEVLDNYTWIYIVTLFVTLGDDHPV
jgi:hypothetical protein